MDFWPFLKLQKMEFGQNKFREINLFDFTSFFGLVFLKFFTDQTLVDTRDVKIADGFQAKKIWTEKCIFPPPTTSFKNSKKANLAF